MLKLWFDLYNSAILWVNHFLLDRYGGSQYHPLDSDLSGNINTAWTNWHNEKCQGHEMTYCYVEIIVDMINNKILWGICWCPKCSIGDKKFFYPWSPPDTRLKKLILSPCLFCSTNCNRLRNVHQCKCFLLIQQSCHITHHFFSLLKGYSSQVTLAICFLIFSVRNLLRSGAIKKAWEPVWFPVVEAFPPLLETKVNRKAEAGRMQKIIYPEDKFRK